MTALETPTGRLLGSWEPGSAPWHAARASRLGGSDMAAVLGRSPWVSLYRLWMLKAGRAHDSETTDAQARGHYLEPAIAHWFADRHPEYDVIEGGTYTHAERDYQLANPDRLLIQNGQVAELLEVKSDAMDEHWGPENTDSVPLYYRTQVMWYLDVLGLKRARIAMIGARLEFREYVVDYDPADAQILRSHAEKFLDSLLFGEVPDKDTTDVTYQTLRELNPNIEDREIEVSLSQAAAFTKAREDLADAKGAWNLARSEMADLMGNAKSAAFLGQRIAVRKSKQGGTPWVEADRKCPPHTDFIAEEFAA
ncbi:YqaJ viral recombinase family protein [Nocardiopsis sp. NRRL B-16309]|uniref:YqaJ viral recombinase family nuclease n=1 Tax=Nocardiopsis sp. NRRL B-16309 TaxID=1519494 RepID=UPI0006AF544E|nr:YqaJ viral recombinase family protein [Nocardiopsis sp. NRRL B-16309]